jgi:hypothetical protein
MGGDPPAPPEQESTWNMLESYRQQFPNFLSITNEGVKPAAEAQLAANQAVAPGLARLQEEIYRAYGPLYAETANKIAADQAQSTAQSDLDVVTGTGRDLVREGIETQKLADPEYFKTRESVSSGLERLLASIDPSGRLSAGENEAISRGIAQQNQSRGIANTPSQTAVVQNAMTFGGAQRDREIQGQNQLGMALQTANQALPALKSGVDAFQTATGKSSMVNAGDSKFTGVDTSLGNSANNLGSNLLGQIGALTQQNNDINANRRDSLDRFNESFSSVVGSL